MKRVFLDHLAGSPPYAAVVEEMVPFLAGECGSPSSVHSMGLRARRAIDAARERVAGLVGAPRPDEIIFTSGGTEAANLAIKGLVVAEGRGPGHIVSTVAEHPAVAESLHWLEGRGHRVTRVGIDALGRVDPAAVADAMTDQTILVAIHIVQHDIGTIQRVAEIGKAVRNSRAAFFCDGAWAAGWMPLDVRDLDCDLLSLSPMRFGGPRGCGALYRRRGVSLEPLVHGGVQEGGLRAGGENVAAIVGAGRAALEAQSDFGERVTRVRGLQERLARGIVHGIPATALNGSPPGEGRVPNSLSFSMACVEAEALALACDLKGLIVGASTSCVSRNMKLSPALLAMGQPEALAAGHLLVGFGRDSTVDDVDYAIGVLAGVAERLRSMSPSWEDMVEGRGDPAVAEWLKGLSRARR